MSGQSQIQEAISKPASRMIMSKTSLCVVLLNNCVMLARLAAGLSGRFSSVAIVDPNWDKPPRDGSAAPCW